MRPRNTPFTSRLQCNGSNSVSNVKLNGGGNSITVNPGASVDLSLDYELANSDTYCPSCIHQILVGYENEVIDCIYSGVPRVCPASTTGSYNKAITAPTEPGTYDIYRTHHLTYTCEQAEAEYVGKGKTKIATITVKCNGSNSVSNVKLNGGGNSITVNPGASVNLSLDYELANGNTYCPSCIHQILVGYENEVIDCIYSGVPRVCPASTTGSYNKAITAPTEPGTYDIYRTHHLTYTCEQAEAEYAGKGKTKIATITVRNQSATLSVSPENPPMQAAAGSSIAFEVSADSDWTVQSNAPWLTVVPPTGSGNGQFFAICNPNNESAPRSAIISVSADGQTVDVNVTQEAGSTPVNGADYTVESFRFIDDVNPNNIQAGKRFKMEAKIKNVGNLAFGSQTRAFYYLSRDNNLDDFDLYLTRDHIDALAIDAINTDKEYITIPANTSPGVYYLIYRADAMEEINEANENNNLASKQIIVTNDNNFNVLCDDFNNYANGGIVNQSTHWTKFASWSLDADVTSAWASDRGKSLQLKHIPLLSDQPEVMLKLGNRNSGTFYLSWKMYVPSGKTAYFDMQESQNNPGSKLNFTFKAEGEAELRVGHNLLKYDYPQDQWFDMSLRYELNNKKVIVSLNGSYYSLVASNWQLGAVHFHAKDNVEFYVDEFCMIGIGSTQMNKSRASVEDVEEIVVEDPRLKSRADLTTTPQTSFLQDTEASLGQNYPNPVSVSTTIPVVVPTGTQDAFIQITGMNGRVLNRIPVGDRGDVRLEVPTQNLTAAIYMYSLVVEGELVDTKRMSVVNER